MVTNTTEREQIVAWLRGMDASDWTALMAGRFHMPWAFVVAAAIERGDHLKESPHA